MIKALAVAVVFGVSEMLLLAIAIALLFPSSNSFELGRTLGRTVFCPFSSVGFICGLFFVAGKIKERGLVIAFVVSTILVLSLIVLGRANARDRISEMDHRPIRDGCIAGGTEMGMDKRATTMLCDCMIGKLKNESSSVAIRLMKDPKNPELKGAYERVYLECAKRPAPPECEPHSG